MLVERFKEETIALELSKVDGKCSIIHDDSLVLSLIGELLGFPATAIIQANTTTESPRKVDINRGFRYVEVSCEIVDRSRVIDAHGMRIMHIAWWSSVISTLPVITDGSLKGTVVHYKDMESEVPISKGSFNMINFNVHANNESKFVGSVLLDH